MLGDYSTAIKLCLTPCSWLWTVPDTKKLKPAKPKEDLILDQLNIKLETPDHFMQSTRCMLWNATFYFSYHHNLTTMFSGQNEKKITQLKFLRVADRLLE